MSSKFIKKIRAKLFKKEDEKNLTSTKRQPQKKKGLGKSKKQKTQSGDRLSNFGISQSPQRSKKTTNKKRTGSSSPKGRAQAKPRTQWDLLEFQVSATEGKTRFHDLDLPVEIMHGIYDLGFEYCTPVQAATLPKALAGVDVSGKAQTGTGKTAAFLITILTHLKRRPPSKKRPPGTPHALIMVPTRELALQVTKDANLLGKYCLYKVVSVFGGMDYQKQKQMLTEKVVDMVVATPGRLLDFKRQGAVNLSKVEILVIDEADEMLDMGFIPDIRQIIRSTPPKTKRQTMFFGATLTSQVTRLASQWTHNAATVDIQPEQVAVDTVNQIVYLVTARKRFTLLYNMITQQHLQRVIVFCNRRDQTRKLAERLKAHGISCAVLSGEVAQKKRIRTLENFRSGKIKVMVSTDVAGRGIHIEAISHVVNYNLPLDPEDYVHRIGRTGRAGASGTSVSFATEKEAYQIPAIEKYLGEGMPCVYPDDILLRSVPPPSAPDSSRAKSHATRPKHRRRNRKSKAS